MIPNPADKATDGMLPAPACSPSFNTPETTAHMKTLPYAWDYFDHQTQEKMGAMEHERDEMHAKLAAIKSKAAESLRISWLYSGRDVVMGIMREIDNISSPNV